LISDNFTAGKGIAVMTSMENNMPNGIRECSLANSNIEITVVINKIRLVSNVIMAFL
jgi:hypothetical protein